MSLAEGWLGEVEKRPECPHTKLSQRHYDRGVMALDAAPSGFEAGDERGRRREKAKDMVSTLYPEWYSPLLRYAFRAGGSIEAAEDAVQDAFMELYRSLLEGETIRNPKGWTLCVVRRRIADQRRRDKRHGGDFLPLSVNITETKESREELPTGCDDSRLTRLLSGLSSREEEVLILRAGGLKYREIALHLRISTNTVKTLLARSIKKMRQAVTTARLESRGSKHYGISKTLQ
jgi:RNA polymerase sigma-70 factor (ECF subfamily)